VHRGAARVVPKPDPTTVMPQPPVPAPVFVDDTGRRRRTLRAVVWSLGTLILIAVVAMWWNQSAGPVRPAPVRTCQAFTAERDTGCAAR
jgi:hypothetical protein